jgi:hypothetical protein
MVKTVKTSTSAWIKEKRVFCRFSHWQDGYGAFTVSHDNRDSVIEYIKNQAEHHRKVPFGDELRAFLIKHGVNYDEQYLV